MVEVDRLSEGSHSPTRDETSNVSTLGGSSYGALATGDNNALLDYSSMAPMGGESVTGTDTDHANVDETTSLLGSNNNIGKNSSDNDLLRPSIFTSVGDSMGAMNNFG